MFFLKHVLWHVKLCVEHHLNQLILFELFVLTAAPCGPGNALQICGCSFLGWVGLGKHWEVCACCPDAETAVILIWIMCELKNELLSLPVTVVRLHACELSPKTATVSAYIDDSMVPWSASMLIAVANLSHLQLAERSAVLRMAMVKAPLPQRMKHVWKEGVIWCSQIWWCSEERKHRMIPTLKMGKVSSESRRCWKAIFAPVLEIAGRMSILMLSTKFVLRFGASPKRHKMLSSGGIQTMSFPKKVGNDEASSDTSSDEAYSSASESEDDGSNSSSSSSSGRKHVNNWYIQGGKRFQKYYWVRFKHPMWPIT